jgi:hypothetical protein
VTNYVVNRLQPGETLIYRGKPSKMAVLFRPVVLLIVAIIFLGIQGSSQNNSNGTTSSGNGFLDFIGLVFLVLFVIGLIRAIIFLRTSEYVVTDRRVVGKYGGIRTHSVDVMMTNIAGADIRQGFFGRIFRYGNVIINGSGASRQLVGISDPTAFQHAVYGQLEMNKLLKGTAAYTLDVRMAPPEAESRPAPPMPTPAPTVAAPPPPAPAPPVNAPPPPAASPSGAVFCAQCGNALAAGARFCSSCSAPVAT